jgi:hypothetical protein
MPDEAHRSRAGPGSGSLWIAWAIASDDIVIVSTPLAAS